MTPPLLLDEIATFVQVVESGSFTAAAQLRGVPKSTVSRAVARLEEAVGAALLARTTRSVALTDAGRALYAEAGPHVAALREAAHSLGERAELRGTLRVTTPVDVGDTFIGDVLLRFAARHPQLHLDVDMSARTVNLVAEGYDCAVRASLSMPDSSLVARRLGESEMHLFAAPAYLARRGAPQTPAELEGHDGVLFRGRDGRQALTLQGPEGPVEATLRGRVSGNELAFLRVALRAAAGVGLLPSIVGAADVAQGRLVRVLPAYAIRTAPIYFVYPRSRQVPRRVLALRDFLVEQMPQILARV